MGHMSTFHVLAADQLRERPAQVLVQVGVDAASNLEVDDAKEVGALRAGQDSSVGLILTLAAVLCDETCRVLVPKEGVWRR